MKSTQHNRTINITTDHMVIRQVTPYDQESNGEYFDGEI